MKRERKKEGKKGKQARKEEEEDEEEVEEEEEEETNNRRITIVSLLTCNALRLKGLLAWIIIKPRRTIAKLSSSNNHHDENEDDVIEMQAAARNPSRDWGLNGRRVQTVSSFFSVYDRIKLCSWNISNNGGYYFLMDVSKAHLN